MVSAISAPNLLALPGKRRAMNRSAPGRDTSLDGPITETEAPMPNGTDDDTSSCTSGSLSVLLAFGQPVTFTATVSNSEPAPHGEDSLGLWQINVDPAQTHNPDTFDCSAIVQWASGTAREGDSGIIIEWTPGPDDDVDLPAVQTDDGLLLPAVQTGAWVADVTYERAASQPESANNLKQIVLAVHALDAGECSLDICAQNSPPASPEPVTHAGWGPWEDNPSLSEDLGIAWVSGDGGTRGPGNDTVLIHNLTGVNGPPAQLGPVPFGEEATLGSLPVPGPASPEPVTHTGGHFELVLEGHSDANLVFDSTGGGRSTVLLPYIEQHGGEADDGGFVIDWTTGDGPKGGDTVGVLAIITPTEYGGSVLEFSVENFPNNSPGPTPVAGFGLDRGHMGSSFDLVFVAQTIFPQRDGNAVATETLVIAHEGFQGDWLPTETIRPMEGAHLYDLVV
jgi:hypothetical protein